MISTFIRTTTYDDQGTPHTHVGFYTSDGAAPLSEHDPIIQGIKDLDSGLQLEV